MFWPGSYRKRIKGTSPRPYSRKTRKWLRKKLKTTSSKLRNRTKGF